MRFAICSSSRNTTLLGDGEVLDEFKALLRAPDAFSLVDVEALLKHLSSCVPPELTPWADALNLRYAAI